MLIIESIEEMKTLSNRFRHEGKTIGFVPTMGCLHSGHLSLVKRSLKTCDVTVVSIFINPHQFGETEDLLHYPTSPVEDNLWLKKEGVNVIFLPRQKTMYPTNFQTNVNVNEITKPLCGKSRPNLFKGVATVVLKLFNIVRPDVAFFGEKDWQQLEVIRTMTRDLNLDTKIEGLPLMRDNDGLAMSSRNQYLTNLERKSALSLNRALKTAQTLVKNGEYSAEKIKKVMWDMISREPHTRIDYISVCDAKTFTDREEVSGKALIALAVHVGRARLIDNCIVEKV